MDPQVDRELLKLSPKRSAHLETVRRAGERSRQVVKRFHGPDLLDRFRDRLRARNEYGLLRRCASLGLPVPRALDLRRRQGAWEVVTEYVENAPPLDRWLQSNAPDLRWRQGARDLGRLVAQLMGAGLAHGDLHPGNFLVQELGTRAPRLWLIDLTKSRLRRRLGAERMVRDLVQLTAGLRERVSDSLRRRFLVQFLRGLPADLRASLPGRAELGRRIEDGAREFRRRDIQRRTRRWLRDSSSVEPYDDERGRGFLRRTMDPTIPTAVQRERAAPSWTGAGALDGNGTGAWVLDGDSWRNLREAWTRQVRLFTHGIPCLAPLCLSRAPAPWLAVEIGAGLTRLDSGNLDGRDPDLRGRAIESLGELVGSLHDRRIEVRDLGLECLWTSASGDLCLGLVSDVRDRTAPPTGATVDVPVSAIQGWSGPWSDLDHRHYRRGYTGALRHSAAERARVLAESQP
ncbi:MAG: tRNA A-37 threonylcarbamoyl transferase component Bud32 [Chlamydiales bacterium]